MRKKRAGFKCRYRKILSLPKDFEKIFSSDRKWNFHWNNLLIYCVPIFMRHARNTYTNVYCVGANTRHVKIS